MSAVAVERYFDAVKVDTGARGYHLNFDRLVAAVELLDGGGIPGRLGEALRERYPALSPQQVHDYFCAAQAIVSSNIDLKELQP